MPRSLAVVGLIAANVVWGSSYVVVKVALRDLSPAVLASLRVTFAAILLWILWLAVPRLGPGSAFLRSPEPISRRDAARMAALGLAGIALSYLLGYHGLSLTTATDASLMIVGEVIFTSLLAVLVAKERLSTPQAVGIGLGAAGIAVLVLGEAGAADGPSGPTRALGDLLVLADVGVQAVYSVAGAGFARRHGVLTTLAFAHAGSLIVWLPVLGWEIAAGRPPDLGGPVLASVLYLAVAVSVGAYLLWFAGLRVLGAGAGAASLFLQPLVGAALGLLLLQEQLSLRVLVGGLLVVGAFVLVCGVPVHLPRLRPGSVAGPLADPADNASIGGR